MTGMRWGATLNVAAGVLLAIAPFALGYYTRSAIAMYEAVAVGVLIGGGALWSAMGTGAPAYVDYIVALLGGWSTVAPFALGYHASVEVAPKGRRRDRHRGRADRAGQPLLHLSGQAAQGHRVR